MFIYKLYIFDTAEEIYFKKLDYKKFYEEFINEGIFNKDEVSFKAFMSSKDKDWEVTKFKIL